MEVKGPVRLDLNESPLPPPLDVIEAGAKALAYLNRYPASKLLQEVERLISEYSGVRRDMIAVGCGGDSILAAIFLLAGAWGGVVVAPRFSFGMYRVLAEESGSRLVRVNMKPEGEVWVLDYDKLLEESRKARLVVVDNPNNPTGSLLLGPARVRELALSTRGLVVIDEAYYEFSGVTMAPLVEEHDNLVVVRTFSKAFSMAGMRIGYLIASPRIASAVKRLFPFPTSTPGLAMAARALRKRSYMESLVKYIRSKREEVRQEIINMGMMAFRSEANFLLVDTGIDGAAERLRSRGVYVRETEIGSSFIRVTIGSSRDMRRFLRELKDIVAG